MPPFARDPAVDRLTQKVRKLATLRAKTAAVHHAQQQRLVRAKAMAEAMGPGDPDFDVKADMDEMWGDA